MFDPSTLEVYEVSPVSTEVVLDGGIIASWTANIGWGEYTLYWGEDGKLHADTEHLDSHDSKNFTKAIFAALVDKVVIDG